MALLERIPSSGRPGSNPWLPRSTANCTSPTLSSRMEELPSRAMSLRSRFQRPMPTTCSVASPRFALGPPSANSPGVLSLRPPKSSLVSPPALPSASSGRPLDSLAGNLPALAFFFDQARVAACTCRSSPRGGKTLLTNETLLPHLQETDRLRDGRRFPLLQCTLPQPGPRKLGQRKVRRFRSDLRRRRNPRWRSKDHHPRSRGVAWLQQLSPFRVFRSRSPALTSPLPRFWVRVISSPLRAPGARLPDCSLRFSLIRSRGSCFSARGFAWASERTLLCCPDFLGLYCSSPRRLWCGCCWPTAACAAATRSRSSPAWKILSMWSSTKSRECTLLLSSASRRSRLPRRSWILPKPAILRCIPA